MCGNGSNRTINFQCTFQMEVCECEHMCLSIPCHAECPGWCSVWRQIWPPTGVSADWSWCVSLLHPLLDVWEGLGLEIPQAQNPAHPKQGMDGLALRKWSHHSSCVVWKISARFSSSDAQLLARLISVVDWGDYCTGEWNS